MAIQRRHLFAPVCVLAHSKSSTVLRTACGFKWAAALTETKIYHLWTATTTLGEEE